MSLTVLGSAPCAKPCLNCSRKKPLRRESCDPHSPCPGYGTTTICPPLIVIAVYETLSLALPQGTRNAFA